MVGPFDVWPGRASAGEGRSKFAELLINTADTLAYRSRAQTPPVIGRALRLLDSNATGSSTTVASRGRRVGPAAR
jgi:hypothetical protein